MRALLPCHPCCPCLMTPCLASIAFSSGYLLNLLSSPYVRSSQLILIAFFFFNNPATPEISPFPHPAPLPIFAPLANPLRPPLDFHPDRFPAARAARSHPRRTGPLARVPGAGFPFRGGGRRAASAAGIR